MKWLAALGKGKVCYFPGPLTLARQKELVSNYKSILSDLGIPFIMIPEFVFCGSQARDAGYEEEFLKVKERNVELLRRHGVTKIITNDPHSAYTFGHEYSIEAEHVLVTLQEHRRKLEARFSGKADYIESGVLRNKLGLTKEGRAVVQAAGFSLGKQAPWPILPRMMISRGIFPSSASSCWIGVWSLCLLKCW
ncbi:MAG: (Fe-S)-binding protein [Nitrosarchaeum sp.]|nr:(Fe-S)-binding protein [Nitrosarchaeum sp.]